MLLVLAMLMTMFIGVGTASAAANFSELRIPTIQTDADNPQDLGSVLIELKDVRALPNAGAWLTVSLPKGCSFVYEYEADYEVQATDNLYIEKIKLTAKDTMEILVQNDYYGDESEGEIVIFFEGVLVKSGSGDVVARFLSNDSAFGTLNTAVIAKIAGDGATTVLPKSVVTIGDAGGEMDTLVIAESSPGSFKTGEVITVKLPKGFEWGLGAPAEGLETDMDPPFPPIINQYRHIAGAWSLASWAFDYDIDGRDLKVYMGEDYGDLYLGPYVKTTEAGRINIGSGTGGFFTITPDDNANFGDVYVTVSSKEGSVKKQDALVAVYGDYGVKVVEDTKEEVYVGRANQELGEFLIEEALAESLDSQRTMYFELPKGVKWAKDESGNPIIALKSEDGTSVNWSEYDFVLSNSDRKVKVVFDFAGDRFSDEAAEFRVKDMEVNIEPSFDQDEIAIKVYGKAGVEGEAVVATVVRPVDVKAENPTKVEIGAMNQAAGDILIIENVDEGILDEYLDGNVLDDEYERVAPQIVVTLPKGVEFSKDPTVEVDEGDLEIDDVEYNDDSLIITIDSASSKKSTIRISDVFLTVDRTVPEGDVVATFKGHKVKEVKDEDNVKRNVITEAGSTALVDWATEESYGKVTVATTITPSQGGHAKFVISSNIYEIGGVPYVMDAVPYIKDSRSYVPMRYLAQMLGAEIAWSEADQTVTLTKEGETEVVFTIGSASYTVNGEAMTADVAPEIVNDRSFLPARFAAEAFGAKVGWDEATQTVIIVR
jgi:hypothetical protein